MRLVKYKKLYKINTKLAYLYICDKLYSEVYYKDDLKDGDLVFFRTNNKSSWHVGVYLWDGQFVHAANRKDDIKISYLWDSSYQKSFKGAGRL